MIDDESARSHSRLAVIIGAPLVAMAICITTTIVYDHFTPKWGSNATDQLYMDIRRTVDLCCLIVAFIGPAMGAIVGRSFWTVRSLVVNCAIAFAYGALGVAVFMVVGFPLWLLIDISL